MENDIVAIALILAVILSIFGGIGILRVQYGLFSRANLLNDAQRRKKLIRSMLLLLISMAIFSILISSFR